MDEEKKVSGKWEWLKSDTVVWLENAVIYGLTVGGIAILEQAQQFPIENQAIAQVVGVVLAAAISALRQRMRDNAKP